GACWFVQNGKVLSEHGPDRYEVVVIQPELVGDLTNGLVFRAGYRHVRGRDGKQTMEQLNLLLSCGDSVEFFADQVILGGAEGDAFSFRHLDDDHCLLFWQSPVFD